MSVEVDQLLTQDFIDGAFGLPIVFENDADSKLRPVVEISSKFNEEKAQSLNDSNQFSGIFTFRILSELGTGAILPKMKCEEIFNRYPVGRVMTTTNCTLEVTGHHRINTPDDHNYVVAGRLLFTVRRKR